MKAEKGQRKGERESRNDYNPSNMFEVMASVITDGTSHSLAIAAQRETASQTSSMMSAACGRGVKDFRNGLRSDGILEARWRVEPQNTRNALKSNYH